jgi:phage integrase family protein
MLTDTKIRQTKPADKPQKLTDSNGLYLLINPNGSKLWRYRFRLGGKETVFAIGAYPTVNLAQARAARDAARELVKQGINPAHNRASMLAEQIADNHNTFIAIAEEFIASKQGKSQTYINGIRRDFKTYVYPTIGNLPINTITPQQVMTCLDKCKSKGVIVTGINVRQRMSSVFMLAIRTLRAERDPTLAFKEYFQRPPIQHAEALSKVEIGEFVRRLKTYNGSRTVVIAIWLLLYTASRTIEIRRAEWADFQLDEGLWTIPANKMKKRRPHTVPLSRQACALLRELHTISGNGKLLFPNSRRPAEMMSATTINRALEYMGVQFSGHDFRATAATRLFEMDYPKEHIDAQLAHAPDNSTDAAYYHAKFIRQRQEMMQTWADFVDSIG